MTVYVDDAVTLWRGRRWAHLMADTLDELHAMAERLGVPRRAFQDKRSGAHYDLTEELRGQALQLGANDYVTKPVDFAVALARVAAQIERRRSELGLRNAAAVAARCTAAAT